MEQQHQQGQPPYSADDEIDLFELVETIWKGKWIIVAIMIFCLLLSGGVIWWMKPVYSSTVYFLPPTAIGLQEINKLNKLISTEISQGEESTSVSFGESNAFGVDDIFQIFLENLTSGELRETIFAEYQLASYYAPNLSEQPADQRQLIRERALSKLRDDLVLVLPGRNSNTQERSLQLVMKKDPGEVATIVQDSFQKAHDKTIIDLFLAIEAERAALINQYQERIRALRVGAASQLKDRLVQLEEAIIIARSLGLAEPGQFGPDVNIQGVANQGLPLYSLGYRYLEAEKEVLIKRKNNDPFIPQLRDLQVMIETLQGFVLDRDKFQVVRLSQSALPAIKPDKPKPVLIIALSIVAGLMLGVMIVLVRQAVINRRKVVAAQES